MPKIFTAFLLVIFLAVLIQHASAAEGPLAIKTVSFPQSIATKERVAVLVSIGYNISSPTKIRAEIWDPLSRNTLLSIPDTVNGTGTRSYNFTLEAPIGNGTWTLVASVWYRNDTLVSWSISDSLIFSITVVETRAETITTTLSTRSSDSSGPATIPSFAGLLAQPLASASVVVGVVGIAVILAVSARSRKGPATTKMLFMRGAKRLISTGHADLDNLLKGGIPAKSAVVLSSPSCDEREMLLKGCLTHALANKLSGICVVTDLAKVEDLIAAYPERFKAIVIGTSLGGVSSQSTVSLVSSLGNLSDLNISMSHALTKLDENSGAGPKGMVVLDIVSDVLLLHKSAITRKWLVDLIPRLKSRGYTVLATFNPQMHTMEEAQTVLDAFDGEIEIFEKRQEARLCRMIAVKRMFMHQYDSREIELRKDRFRI